MSSAGLIQNSATAPPTAPPQPVHPHHEGIPAQPVVAMSPTQAAEQAFAQPLAPQPDPSRPTITPQEAYQTPANPESVPPHTEQQHDTGLAMDQVIRGFVDTVNRWEIINSAYRGIQESVTGKRQPPVVSFPTGVHNDEGDPEICEIDLNAVIPTGIPEEQRVQKLREMLTPWNNYLVKEWQRLWMKLMFFAMQGAASLDPEHLLQEAAKVMLRSPDRLLDLATRLSENMRAVAEQPPAPPAQPPAPPTAPPTAVGSSQLPAVPQ